LPEGPRGRTELVSSPVPREITVFRSAISQISWWRRCAAIGDDALRERKLRCGPRNSPPNSESPASSISSRLVCVETGNIAENEVRLAADAEHQIQPQSP